MRFCFYSGYRDVKGGYTTLLLTLIKELKRQKYEVVLFNFSDGLIVSELEREGFGINLIDLDTIKWNEIDQRIFPTDIFIITRFLEVYKNLFEINPRFIYYDINDFICQISDYKFGLRLPFLGKRLVQKLLAKKSLVFMDDTGIFNLKDQFFINIPNPEFLPVPVMLGKENKYIKEHQVEQAILKLTYIGRSVDWKMMPLKKILKDCARIANFYRIYFTILVDNIDNFHRFIDLTSLSNVNGLTINLVENMLPSEINDFLINCSDLHFAMGTAALEAAKLGIPTILVDFSTKEIKDNYQYRWLFESRSFSLGKNLDRVPLKKGAPMETIILKLLNDSSRLDISHRSYNYVAINHSVNKVVNKLVELSKVSEFRIRDARLYIPYYFKSHYIIKKIASLLATEKE